MLCLIGPSASGKSVCEKELEKRGWNRIISYTTRPMRVGETQDVEYHFISQEEFIKRYEYGFFAERTNYRSWFYGIAEMDCIDDAIAVIEPNGFRALQRIEYLNIKSFFLKVSERTRLIRMAHRGDDINEIFRRLYSDQGSFACIEEEVDYVVENESRTVAETVDEILTLLGGKN